MNSFNVRKACLELGYSEPISIEENGIVWLGPDDDRQYLTEQQQAAVWVRATAIEAEYLATHPAYLTPPEPDNE